MVQNMSGFTCPNCESTYSIFGRDGVAKKCNELNISLLGNLPLDERICEDADRGKPTVVAEPDSQRAKLFTDITTLLRQKLDF